MFKKNIFVGTMSKQPPITDYDASITNREFGIFQTICVMIINGKRYAL
jgi:hypothetical protein